MERIHILINAYDLPIGGAKINQGTCRLRSPTLKIKIGKHIQESDRESADDGISALPNLAASLREVRGLQHVELQCLEQSTLVATTLATMCGRRRNPVETMKAVTSNIDRGTRSSCEGDDRRTNVEYKASSNAIHGSHFDNNESFEILIGGPFDGMLAGE